MIGTHSRRVKLLFIHFLNNSSRMDLTADFFKCAQIRTAEAYECQNLH